MGVTSRIRAHNLQAPFRNKHFLMKNIPIFTSHTSNYKIRYYTRVISDNKTAKLRMFLILQTTNK